MSEPTQKDYLIAINDNVKETASVTHAQLDKAVNVLMDVDDKVGTVNSSVTDMLAIMLSLLTRISTSLGYIATEHAVKLTPYDLSVMEGRSKDIMGIINQMSEAATKTMVDEFNKNKKEKE